MAQSPGRQHPTRTSSVLWVALGAVAGVALGLLVANRLRGVDGTLRRGGRGRRGVPSPEGWRNDAPHTEGLDGLSDDDAELAGESIAHIHVLRRGEHHGTRPDTSPRADLAMTPGGLSVPTHDELESRVLEAFQNDPVLKARAIDIGVVDSGTIELTGWVASTGEIAHALTLARGVPGVAAVVDHLAVRGAGAFPSHRAAQYTTPPRP